MNDFKSDSNVMLEKMLENTKKVFESGWYVLGNEVKNFEHQWAEICKVKNAIGVANGMDAIEIILKALKIGPGDEVITTPMTAFATVLAILKSGAQPILADINPETALLNFESVGRCISKRTKAIILVHLYGQIREMGKWDNFCNESDIYLIEDCAQAHLAQWENKYAGSFGIAGAFSFYPTKNLGAIGDAGMIITNSEDLSNMSMILRNYGQSIRYHHPEIGLNSRMDELQAAILIARLPWLVEFTERRIEIANVYFRNINNPSIELMDTPHSNYSHVFHLFVLKCENRELFQQYLRNNGIETLIHYPIPIHFQKPCLNLPRDPKGLKYSEKHAERCISIPCHPHLKNDEVAKIIDVINSFNNN